jgi:hypothetical protein
MQFDEQAHKFVEELPYRQGEYAGRNWGHPWHSLCSYHGKLKPAIAHMMIRDFTKPGDVIFDPLCGVGTIPFEACIQGRVGIGNDLSRMAYSITKAKVQHPVREDVDIVVHRLEEYIEQNKAKFDVDPLPYSDFGYNGKVPTYFEKNTYMEILAAREFFMKIKDLTAPECMVLSVMLHILHGNRPYALSRNSHPLTPYAPTGDFVYKNVIEHINDKLNISYKKADLSQAFTGKSIHNDFSKVTYDDVGGADWIITSPPFTGSIRFYIQNWMRLWFVGWESEDFKQADLDFLEAKQKKDMDIYYDFFKMCASVLKPEGRIILHLGNSKVCDMAEELAKRSTEYFDEVFRGAENVSDIEKHGIADKGATFEHQYLFLQKK